jgi:hypothetical protein
MNRGRAEGWAAILSPVEVRVMWVCPKCAAKVDEGFEICWSCGTSPDGIEDPGFDPEFNGVLGEEDYQAAQAARVLDNPVTIGVFWSAPEAHVLRSRLESEGIHAYVTDELATSMTWGLLNDAGGIKLQVAEKDVERSRKILADKVHPETAGSADEEE